MEMAFLICQYSIRKQCEIIFKAARWALILSGTDAKSCFVKRPGAEIHVSTITNITNIAMYTQTKKS